MRFCFWFILDEELGKRECTQIWSRDVVDDDDDNTKMYERLSV